MSQFLEVPTVLITNSNENPDFNIYLQRSNGSMVLYSQPQKFSEKHRQNLIDNNITKLFIENNESITYDEFVKKNLPQLIMDDNVSADDKANIIYTHSTEMIKSAIFKESHGVPLDTQKQLLNLVDYVFDFLVNHKGGLESFSKLIATHYAEYIHSVNVMVYAMAFLIFYYNKTDQKLPLKSTLRYFGLGALLHDVGKLKISSCILNKPGRLNKEENEEIKKHVVYGVDLCQSLNLDELTIHIILFHHEKKDGSGYPMGTTNIPFYPQIVTICDIYDAMTCNRPYRARKFTPFETLKTLRKDAEKNKINPELFKHFVEMISSNQFTL